MLVERFLDCDTSVEEERELARFYQECMDNGCIPEGEEDICRLVTATVKWHTVEESIGHTDNTAPHMAHNMTPGPKCTSRPRRRPWQWMVAACAIGIIVAGVAFALATRQGDSPALADADTSIVQPICTMGHEEAENTYAPTTAAIPSKADAPDTPHDESTSMPTMPRQKKPTTTTRRQNKPATLPTPNISNICHAAMDAFHDATDISIERKGNALLLSTAADDGTCRRYVIDEETKGQMTLIEI